ncbi:MAG: hypothetical protein NVS2B15_12100 [Pseudarthrobacter sp.]
MQPGVVHSVDSFELCGGLHLTTMGTTPGPKDLGFRCAAPREAALRFAPDGKALFLPYMGPGFLRTRPLIVAGRGPEQSNPRVHPWPPVRPGLPTR